MGINKKDAIVGIVIFLIGYSIMNIINEGRYVVPSVKNAVKNADTALVGSMIRVAKGGGNGHGNGSGNGVDGTETEVKDNDSGTETETGDGDNDTEDDTEDDIDTDNVVNNNNNNNNNNNIGKVNNNKQKQGNDNEKQSKLLLNKPFYIYEELDFLNETSSVTTIGNFTFQEWIHLSPEQRGDEQRGGIPYKHDDDLKFYLAAVRHPMRVYHPADAELFVMPALTTYISYDIVYGDTRTRVCRHNVCGRDLLFYTDSVLKNSTWYQKSNGADHIITTTTFIIGHPLIRRNEFKNIKNCNVIAFGEGSEPWNAKNRLSFNTFYVGTPCHPMVPFDEKTHDFTMIASLVNSPKFADRKHICEWTKSDEFISKKLTMDICGRGIQCPSLSKARLGFHVRGDSISANRLFDTLLSGTVPVFTLEEQYHAHQEWIDWEELSFYVPVGVNATQTTFLQSIDTLLSNVTEIERKTQNVIDNRDLFDWDTLIPFDTYMYMLQAHLWPETRVNQSAYSALNLSAVPSPPAGTA